MYCKMSKITDNLYLGDIDDARNCKVNFILNLSGENVNNRHGGYVIDIPMEDDEKFPIKNYFDETYRLINYIVNVLHKKLLVNCRAGVSRSVTIVTNYIMRKYNISLDNALKYIKNKRPIADPNSGFINQLEKVSLVPRY